MKQKKFDCVQMKGIGQLYIKELTKNMSQMEYLSFLEKQTKLMRDAQKKHQSLYTIKN